MPAVDSPSESNGAVSATATRRSRPIYRVFVSSTWLDLQPERRALMEALNRMEEMRFVGMEFFGNRPDDTHDASIDQVDLCEVFVGIIGHRYGSGITAAEYRRARARNLPCFVYFKRGEAAGVEQNDNDPALAAQLHAFKQELLRGHTVKDFDRPEELAASATADLHNWVAARWISLEREPEAARPRSAAEDADRTNSLRLVERVDQDWVKGVLEASLHHRAWLELGLDWREDAVEHPWDRIVVAPDRPIRTLDKQDSITGVFDTAQHTLLVLGEPGAGKTTTVLELARDLIARARSAAAEPVPAVLALSNWRGQHKDLAGWLVAELGLRYQVPKRVANTWLEEGRLVLILDGLDEVIPERRAACVEAINAFEQAHPPSGLAVTCRVAEYDALTVKLRLRAAICLQPLTPAQIERYFAVAGKGLDHLRQALREDAGLRELARSPLMLSVMTMAWRDAPAGTTAPFAAARTPEELRRGLFDAYVQAALKRRGKASGNYAAGQTMKWLTWLAQRMKENGHTLFALEQLQPSWLDGTWRQFGYFITSRLLGSMGLMLLGLFLNLPDEQKLALAGLSLVAGCYMGVIDFTIALHGWGGHRRAALRLWTQLAGLLVLGLSWIGLCPFQGEDAAVGGQYILLLMVAFCAPVDVRGLDIKPTGSMQWSWRLALKRGLACLVFVNLFVILLYLVNFTSSATLGVAESLWRYLVGFALAAVPVVFGWFWLRPAPLLWNVVRAVTLAMIGGRIAVVVMYGENVNFTWLRIMSEVIAPVLFGVFGGFGSTLIDPSRPQQAGAWFWLRVPVIALFVVGLVLLVPSLLVLSLMSAQLHPGELGQMARGFAVFAAGSGLIAFLRFGGFNGAQHFLLRWQLARSGHLPARPEAFLNHAAQLALLQKVGLGYRFVHALLLQHLAATEEGKGARAQDAEPAVEGDHPGAVRWTRGQRRLRLAVGLGLMAGLGLFTWIAVMGHVTRGLGVTLQGWNLLPAVLGSLMLSVALGIPLWLIVGRSLLKLSWNWLGTACVGFALVLGYLVWDEKPLRPPMSIATLVPAFPGAEKSYAVLKRYNYNEPAGQNFRWGGLNYNQSPKDEAVWREFLGKHRSEIEADWNALTPLRAWLDELNTFSRIADLAENPLEWTVISYPVVHACSRNTMAIAGIRALNGQGDTALLGLLPLLEASGKIEAAARMGGIFGESREMQYSAILAADFVLKTAPVSAPVRARFAAALAHHGGPEGLRHGFAIWQAKVAAVIASSRYSYLFWDDPMIDSVLRPLGWMSPIVFNRQATLNRWDSLFVDLTELAVRRDIAGLEKREADFMTTERRVAFKNVGGVWFSWMMLYRINLEDGGKRTVLGYWATEDLRTALLQRLQQPERK